MWRELRHGWPPEKDDHWHDLKIMFALLFIMTVLMFSTIVLVVLSAAAQDIYWLSLTLAVVALIPALTMCYVVAVRTWIDVIRPIYRWYKKRGSHA